MLTVTATATTIAIVFVFFLYKHIISFNWKLWLPLPLSLSTLYTPSPFRVVFPLKARGCLSCFCFGLFCLAFALCFHFVFLRIFCFRFVLFHSRRHPTSFLTRNFGRRARATPKQQLVLQHFILHFLSAIFCSKNLLNCQRNWNSNILHISYFENCAHWYTIFKNYENRKDCEIFSVQIVFKYMSKYLTKYLVYELCI